jgi:surface protein
MIKNASVFNQPISSWYTHNVTDMNEMFSGASAFNQPIGNWNTENVTNMYSMFNDATAFNQPIGKWSVGNLMYATTMFNSNINYSVANYDSLLVGWGSQTLYQNVIFEAIGLKYSSCEAKTARQKMIDTYHWQITDGGLEGHGCVVTTTQDYTLAPSIQIYPSPAHELLYLEGLDLGETLSFYDASGHSYSVINHQNVANISNLPRGLYSIKVGEKTLKVVLD